MVNFWKTNVHNSISLLSKDLQDPSRIVCVAIHLNIKTYPMQAGFNNQLMDIFGTIVSKLSDTDRLCTLMFDEMAVKEFVSYSGKDDKVVGFEDFRTFQSLLQTMQLSSWFVVLSVLEATNRILFLKWPSWPQNDIITH